MRYLVIALLLSLLPSLTQSGMIIGGGAPPSSGVTDNFNRTDGALGANWTTITSHSAPAIASNVVGFTAGGGASTGARYSGATFANDQYAEAKVTASATDNGSETTEATSAVVVRCSTSQWTYYALISSQYYFYDVGELLEDFNGTKLVYYVNGTGYEIHLGSTKYNYLRLEVSGASNNTTVVAKGKQNSGDSWTTIHTSSGRNDGIGSGYAGILGTNENADSSSLDDFSAGDL